MQKRFEPEVAHAKKQPWFNSRKLKLTIIAFAALNIASLAFTFKGPTIKNVLAGANVPVTALTYENRTREYTWQEMNNILAFFTQPYCRVIVNPTYEYPGMWVVRSSSTDPLQVGMAFLKKAARERGVDLSIFDPEFLERLAYKVGRFLITHGCCNKATSLDLRKFVPRQW